MRRRGSWFGRVFHRSQCPAQRDDETSVCPRNHFSQLWASHPRAHLPRDLQRTGGQARAWYQPSSLEPLHHWPAHRRLPRQSRCCSSEVFRVSDLCFGAGRHATHLVAGRVSFSLGACRSRVRSATARARPKTPFLAALPATPGCLCADEFFLRWACARGRTTAGRREQTGANSKLILARKLVFEGTSARAPPAPAGLTKRAQRQVFGKFPRPAPSFAHVPRPGPGAGGLD